MGGRSTRIQTLRQRRLRVFKIMTYNGWTNYETWNVALWMDHDEPSYNWARSCKTFKQYRNGVAPKTGDGVSLYNKKLNHKELDDKIRELGE